jgi:hypothetical protein
MDQIAIPLTCIRNVNNNELPYYRMGTNCTDKPRLLEGLPEERKQASTPNTGNLEKGRKNRLKHLPVPKEEGKKTRAQFISEQKENKLKKEKEEKMKVLSVQQ